MDYFAEKNNRVYVMGEIVSEAKFSHEVYGEGFYEFYVKVMRLSGQADILPVTVSERLIKSSDLKLGSTISALGQFRSYNKLENGKSRLMLTVFVRELVEAGEGNNPNSIVLSGYICKPPIYRTTPLTAKSRIFFWRSTALTTSPTIFPVSPGAETRFVQNLKVGDRVALSGRIQSREYQKRLSETDVVTMTAYEVSVSKLAAFEDGENFDLDGEFDLYAMPSES